MITNRRRATHPVRTDIPVEQSLARSGSSVFVYLNPLPDTLSNPFTQLCACADEIGFENQTIDHLVAPDRRLERKFSATFPLRAKLYAFPDASGMAGSRWLNWHEHYELIIPLAGSGVFQTGHLLYDYEPGDLIVVDSLKMHGMAQADSNHRSLVIHFRPELVAEPNSPPHDSAFLWPFTRRPPGSSPIVAKADAGPIHAASVGLLETLSDNPRGLASRANAKLHLLSILNHARTTFGLDDIEASDETRSTMQRQRVQRAMAYLYAHFPERVLLADAARAAGTSPTRFKTVFPQIAGMTFGEALTRIRVVEASRLLRGTDLPISKISQQVGFSDQSHLVRRFRGIMHLTPSAYRQGRSEAWPR